MTTTKPGKATAGAASAGKTVAKEDKAPRPAKAKAKGGAGAGKASKASKASKAEQALANTRALLQSKQAHDRATPAWHALDAKSRGKAPKPGYQSEEAKMRAAELHEGEMHLKGIDGSIGTQDRLTQGKRDSR